MYIANKINGFEMYRTKMFQLNQLFKFQPKTENKSTSINTKLLVWFNFN